MKLSDLTPEMIAVLRLDAALEKAYGDTRSRRILEKLLARRAAR